MPLTLDPVSRASKWLKPKNKVKSWRDFLVGELTGVIAQIPYVEPGNLGYEALQDHVRDGASKR
jgi:hypothetical protein